MIFEISKHFFRDTVYSNPPPVVYSNGAGPGSGATNDANTAAWQEYYKKYYVFWSKFILIEVIPYAAIIVFNALILAKTVKAAKFRRKFGHSGGGGQNRR